jgi:4-hydroxy-2-oxoheptanedioate aldolase
MPLSTTDEDQMQARLLGTPLNRVRNRDILVRHTPKVSLVFRILIRAVGASCQHMEEKPMITKGISRVLVSLITITLGLPNASTLVAQAAPQNGERPTIYGTYTNSQDTVQQPPQGDPNYKPKRINKVIELLEAGQHVWFTAATGERDYEDGKRMAQTYADYIDYPLEHEPFDMGKLRRFMQGLVDGGPTRSGHRTPAVIVTLPVLGISETETRANDWMVNQVLAAGVHGIMFCRARNPGSVRALLEAARWPFNKQGVGPGKLGEGYRGSGSEGFAARIWGLSHYEYMQKSDFWPLNPNGELILGLKIEDKYADANMTETFQVPGIAFAEAGSSDATLSYVGLQPPGSDMAPEVMAHSERVRAATKAAGIFLFDGGYTLDNIEEKLKEGGMISRVSQEIADKARKITKRQMPW